MDIIGNRQESKQISTDYSVERIALIDRQPILWWRWFAGQLKTLHSFYKTKPTTSTGPPSHLWGLLGADKTQWRGSFQLIAANIGTNCDTVSDTHTHRGRLATISIPRERNKGQLISDFFHVPCVLVCWGFSTSKRNGSLGRPELDQVGTYATQLNWTRPRFSLFVEYSHISEERVGWWSQGYIASSITHRLRSHGIGRGASAGELSLLLRWMTTDIDHQAFWRFVLIYAFRQDRSKEVASFCCQGARWWQTPIMGF